MAGNAPLSGKHVAVVGANRGIGLEFVRQLLAKGNSVHATARKPEQAEQLQALRQQGASLTLAALDTSSPESIASWASDLKGHQPFDLLLNIAGVADTTRAGLDSITAEKMLHCFQTNAIGPLLVVQALLREGLLARGGTVANMTSKMGSVTDNSSGRVYAYRASKSALNNITKSMSIDLQGEGITALLLHPGWVRTDMTSSNGLIDVDECVSGLLSVLEGDRPLNGRFFDYKGKEIPW